MGEPAAVVVAGATGNLGGRIAMALAERGVPVKALVRRSAAAEKLERLRACGAAVAPVDFGSVSELAAACAGARCVVSALAGLRETIVEAQSALLEGAVRAGAPRFIPSDYSIDFTRFPAGENRNLDLRREFHGRLDRAPVRATSIFNGAFTDMLTGPMPLILFKLRRVLYWGSADQRMDFTTVDDTAAFTACAALDDSAPRFLRIAGDELSARELAAAAAEARGMKFRLLRAGSLSTLGAMIRIARAIQPGERDLYPAWQGMQYMRNMFDGRAKMQQLDNGRYAGIRWTSAREILAHEKSRAKDGIPGEPPRSPGSGR